MIALARSIAAGERLNSCAIDACCRAGDRLHVELQLLGVAQEFEILHHGVEGGAQRRDLLVRQATRPVQPHEIAATKMMAMRAHRPAAGHGLLARSILLWVDCSADCRWARRRHARLRRPRQTNAIDIIVTRED
jgi:hypothetical protein